MSARMSVYVYTSDLERMRQFYEAGLDIKPASQQGNWLPFELGGATFALHGTRDAAPEVLQRFNLTKIMAYSSRTIWIMVSSNEISV